MVTTLQPCSTARVCEQKLLPTPSLTCARHNLLLKDTVEEGDITKSGELVKHYTIYFRFCMVTIFMHAVYKILAFINACMCSCDR